MKPDGTNESWSLAQLAERTGCPARTIRYYIARGLLPPPHKAGRAASYGAGHARRIEQIRTWQAEGLALAEIGYRLADESKSPDAPEPVAWWAFEIAPDVVVQVRSDANPWRLRAVRRAAGELARRLDSAEETSRNKPIDQQRNQQP